ncbi:MAG: hypothetical protein AAF940_12430, partial [Pseudomonadota bacterium]
MPETHTVSGLDKDGYGVATTADGATIRVDGALPGDVVSGLVLDGVLDSPAFVERTDNHRVPPCADFVECGGCQAQHMNERLYREWKRGLPTDALAVQNIDCPIGEMVMSAPASRRRAAFSLRYSEKGVELGFQQARSHRIIAFAECQVIAPVLNKARGALKALARAALPMMAVDAKPATSLVTVTKSGLDVALTQVARLNS